MRSGPRIAPTRVNLLRARQELARVQHGAALIRRKREALVSELFRAARPAIDMRESIAATATEASEALWQAFAVHGDAGLTAQAWPAREIALEIRPAQVWGIPVSDVISRPPMARNLEARGTAPGLTGPSGADAATQFEKLADLLIEAAPREQRVRRLGDAVARTSRQMRTLEQRVAPLLVQRIGEVRRALDEREREERIRLKHVGRTLHPRR